MDDNFIKRFIAAVRKGLTDEMVAEQMDLSVAEVQVYKRRLFADIADELDKKPRSPEAKEPRS